MNKKVDEFKKYREQMNNRLLSAENNKIIKRIYSLDTISYQEGALSSKTKELLGLVSSLVLRCDDCVKYHLIKCKELGTSEDEIIEVIGIANLVGGTIVIPHSRRAIEFWDDLLDNDQTI